MKQSQQLLDNAVACAKLAARTMDQEERNRFRRIEAAWRSLAREQDWLDGQITPIDAPRLAQPTPPTGVSPTRL